MRHLFTPVGRNLALKPSNGSFTRELHNRPDHCLVGFLGNALIYDLGVKSLDEIVASVVVHRVEFENHKPVWINANRLPPLCCFPGCLGRLVCQGRGVFTPIERRRDWREKRAPPPTFRLVGLSLYLNMRKFTVAR